MGRERMQNVVLQMADVSLSRAWRQFKSYVNEILIERATIMNVISVWNGQQLAAGFHSWVDQAHWMRGVQEEEKELEAELVKETELQRLRDVDEEREQQVRERREQRAVQAMELWRMLKMWQKWANQAAQRAYQMGLIRKGVMRIIYTRLAAAFGKWRDITDEVLAKKEEQEEKEEVAKKQKLREERQQQKENEQERERLEQEERRHEQERHRDVERQQRLRDIELEAMREAELEREEEAAQRERARKAAQREHLSNQSLMRATLHWVKDRLAVGLFTWHSRTQDSIYVQELRSSAQQQWRYQVLDDALFAWRQLSERGFGSQARVSSKSPEQVPEVRIVKTRTAKDNGKPCVFFILEVSGDDARESFQVPRRYRDFDQLDKMMTEEFAHLKSVLPCLPPKKSFGSLDPHFISNRKVTLERYLGDLMQIPQVDQCMQLKAFLSQELSEWHDMMEK